MWASHFPFSRNQVWDRMECKAPSNTFLRYKCDHVPTLPSASCGRMALITMISHIRIVSSISCPYERDSTSSDSLVCPLSPEWSCHIAFAKWMSQGQKGPIYEYSFLSSQSPMWHCNFILKMNTMWLWKVALPLVGSQKTTGQESELDQSLHLRLLLPSTNSPPQ